MHKYSPKIDYVSGRTNDRSLVICLCVAKLVVYYISTTLFLTN